MIRRIPVAWLQLTRGKVRFAVALAGIGFADILMFMQLGLREALFDSAVSLYKDLDGEIALINPQSSSLVGMRTFSQRTLYQALAVEAVKSVHPIYLKTTDWKNPQTRQIRNIYVIGVNPNDQVLKMPGVEQDIDKINLPDVVLFDRRSRKEFGPIATEFDQGKTITTEVGGRRIKVGGTFVLGTSFAINGTLVTSDLNFLRIFKERKSGLIDIGMISLKPGEKTEVVLKELRKYLPQNVKVLSKQELIEFEKAYWQSNTAVGFIFALGTVIGFLVGTVIVYQILYSEVADHLSEYATLKAIGYKQTYLLLLVFQEAIILAILGYLPGFAFAIVQYNLTKSATLLPIAMTVNRAIVVLGLTNLMCLISGAITMHKLRAADPADVF